MDRLEGYGKIEAGSGGLDGVNRVHPTWEGRSRQKKKTSAWEGQSVFYFPGKRPIRRFLDSVLAKLAGARHVPLKVANPIEGVLRAEKAWPILEILQEIFKRTDD